MTTDTFTQKPYDDPYADSVCECGHWWEEHDDENEFSGEDMCWACEDDDVAFHPFKYDPEENTPEALADRGGPSTYRDGRLLQPVCVRCGGHFVPAEYKGVLCPDCTDTHGEDA